MIESLDAARRTALLLSLDVTLSSMWSQTLTVSYHLRTIFGKTLFVFCLCFLTTLLSYN